MPRFDVVFCWLALIFSLPYFCVNITVIQSYRYILSYQLKWHKIRACKNGKNALFFHNFTSKLRLQVCAKKRKNCQLKQTPSLGFWYILSNGLQAIRCSLTEWFLKYRRSWMLLQRFTDKTTASQSINVSLYRRPSSRRSSRPRQRRASFYLVYARSNILRLSVGLSLKTERQN